MTREVDAEVVEPPLDAVERDGLDLLEQRLLIGPRCGDGGNGAAKHRDGDWTKITVTLDHSWPGLEIDVLSDALELAGRLLDGSAVTGWGVA